MDSQLLVGDAVHGMIDGFDEHYECSRVEAFGSDWAVLRHIGDGQVCTGTGPGIVDAPREARNGELPCRTADTVGAAQQARAELGRRMSATWGNGRVGRVKALEGWLPGRGPGLTGRVEVHSVFGGHVGADEDRWSYAMHWHRGPVDVDELKREVDPRCRYRLNGARDLWVLEVWSPPRSDT